MLEKLKKLEDGTFEDVCGVNYDSKADYMFCNVLPSCGCGSPEDIGRYVRDMLLKHVGRPEGPSSPWGGHPEWGNNSYEDFPVMFFLSWADSCGYIEHGTTIRCSWLTTKGKELLRDLDEVLAEVK